MDKKKLVCYIMLGIMLFSCTNKSLKIGLLIPNTFDERFPHDKEFLIAKATELGVEVLSESAENDANLQIKQAQDMLNSGIGVLIVCPVNKNTAAVIVRQAHEYNVKVIAYERIISNCNLDYYISYNSVKVGEIMARYALDRKPEGNWILFGGDKSDNNAILVRKGWGNIIDDAVKKNKIHILYQCYIEDWSGEEAYNTLKNILKLSGVTPNVVLSAYDGMSTGVIKAFDEISITGVLLTGQNAETTALKNILKQRQSMTVYKPFKTQAEQAAILAVKCIKNQKIEEFSQFMNNGLIDVPSILLEPIMVDNSNIKSTVVADGFFKE